MSEILKNNESGNNEIPAAQEWSTPDRVADEPEKNSLLRLVDTGFYYDQRDGHHGEVLHNYVLRFDIHNISKEAPDVYNIVQRLSTQAKNYDQDFNKHVRSSKSINDITVYSTKYDKEEYTKVSLGILPVPPDFPDTQNLSFVASASISFLELVDNSQISSLSPGSLSVSMVHEDDAWIISLENYGYMKTDISDRKTFRSDSEQFTLKYSKKMPGAKLKDGIASEYDDAMGHRVGGSFEMGKRR